MVLAEVVYYLLRLANGHRAVARSVDNPQRHVLKAVVFAQCGAAAEGHGSRHFLGIEGAEVECAVAAETHSEHIDACWVGVVVVECPLQQAVYLLRVPLSAGVLRCHHHSLKVHTALHGIERAIAQHAVQVVAAQACPVEKHH